MAKIKKINLEDMISEKLIIFSNKANKKEDILLEMSELLSKNGYVKNSFYDGIKNREESFPTGLITPSGNVAIPHTDSEHVKKPAIAVAVLKSPVNFYRMDDASEKIEVDIIFMLAIKEKENQVGVISNLISAFKGSNLLGDLKKSNSKEEAFKYMKNNLE
ncbi:PTS sugar transporter subunit IIA [Halanaerobium hydrogeniformans]|uniref:PTS IIA-like nitrogen-regulatory protein PtsN n=1 Tax=Halanaerobium hydrogeniformans TaxID=656519 RepID=E4RNF7_HALHG|nr:PTS sugar transporter subunit IIA [Halanaerobium hydrogeniformans]ADQ13625.1 putative PTS IIA-like nitrogen-regulatory protein PtsN [Halanaerobium hydrogeniformans]